MKNSSVHILTVAALFALGQSASWANTYTYDFNQSFGGATPSGNPPWLEATFSDTGLPANTVQLTLSAVNLAPNESVTSWYFNLNPVLDPNALSFASSATTGSFDSPSVQTGVNMFKAAGSGKFDVLFSFSGFGKSSDLFGAGDSVTFTITGIPGLNASDFGFLSTAGGSGPYTSAANITSGDQSGWVDPANMLHSSALIADLSVPDAANTLALLSFSLLSFWILKRQEVAHTRK